MLELAATKISYQAVQSKVFSIRPDSSARVVNVATPSASAGAPAAKHGKAKGKAEAKSGHRAEITGAQAVQSHLSFNLTAPAQAGGLHLSGVRLLGQGKDAGALVSYGQGLGGVYVIERPASSAKGSSGLGTSSSSNPDQRGLSLPTVKVGHGASAQELDTALGTVLQFTSGGVSYTVLGSVAPAKARGVADAL